MNRKHSQAAIKWLNITLGILTNTSLRGTAEGAHENYVSTLS